MGVFCSSYWRWEVEDTIWRRIVGCGGGMENCRFGRRCAFGSFVSPFAFGCRSGFEPELVWEGWWLQDKLADWRWMNEGPYWRERVWGCGCAARKIIGVWVCAGYL